LSQTGQQERPPNIHGIRDGQDLIQAQGDLFDAAVGVVPVAEGRPCSPAHRSTGTRGDVLAYLRAAVPARIDEVAGDRRP